MASLGLAFDILARDKASKDINQVSDSLGKAAKAGSFFGTVAGSAVSKGIGLIAGAAKAAIGQLGDTIEKASALNESLSKSQAVFGQGAAQIEAFSKTTAATLGISQQAALEAAATFGNLFNALQIAPAQSADLSKTLVTLAGDLASFNNASTDDALGALRAGLQGESEPLKRFSVFLSDARIQAEALASGIVKPVANTQKLQDAQVSLAIATEKARVALEKNGKGSIEAVAAQQRVEAAARAVAAATEGQVPALTGAQKAQAAFNIIMKDTKTAQGDAARTGDQFAGQQRRLGAAIDELKTKIGQQLLPYMAELTTFMLNVGVPAISGFVDGMANGTGKGGQFAEILKGLAGAAKATADVLLPMLSFLAEHSDILTSVAIGAAALVVQMKLMAGYAALKGILFGVAAGEAAVGTAAAGAAPKVGLLTGAIARLRAAAAVPIVLSVFVNTKVGDRYTPQEVTDLHDKFLGITQPGSGVNSLAFQDRRSAASDDPKHDPAFQKARAQAVAAAEDTAKAAGKAATAAYKAEVPKITPAISEAIKAGLQKAVDAAQDVVDAIGDRFSEAKSKLGELVQEALNFRREIADALTRGSGLGDVFGTGTNLNANGAFGGAGGDFERIKRFLQNRLDRIRKFTAELRTLLARGLNVDLVGQIAQMGVDAGSRISAGLLAGGASGIRDINHLTGAIGTVGDATGRTLASAKFGEMIREQRRQTDVLHNDLSRAERHLHAISAKLGATTTGANQQRAAAYAAGGA